MMFTDNQDFKRILEAKEQDIYQRTSDGVQEMPQFQRLYSLLAQCRRKYKEQDYRLILISKKDLLSLCDNADIKANELFTSAAFLTNRTVCVNDSLSIIYSNNNPFPADNNAARRFFASLANADTVVFHISPKASVNYFIDGKDYGDGVFYTLDAKKNYEELKTIDELEEVLNEYRIILEHQDTYLKFFVPKSELKTLKFFIEPDADEKVFLKANHHLLHNKPEELFREDIRNFIKQHMRVVVTREVTLEDLDRLDIELTDEGGRDMYFIEIKWVGESIHADGNKRGTEYKANPRIKPDAVIQVVKYINELLKEKQNVKLGYLAVFDARKEDLPDTGTDINENDLPEELRGLYHRFKKLDDFRVKNFNPR